jgi:16S rRNA (uracil1498-N3)-methyltransferase
VDRGSGPEDVAERAAAAAQVFVTDPQVPQVDEEDVRHLVRVLRLRRGEVVVAADGRGAWCRCRFRGADDPGGLLDPDGPLRREAPPGLSLTVAFAPAKGDRPEWVVQKLTEIGIDRIVLLATDRSVVRWDTGREGRALERLRRVAKEAAAQCRRTWLPEVGPVTTVLGLVADAGRPGDVRLAQLGGGPPAAGDHAVAVGPEGGWSPEEAELGGPPLGLGPTVLRAETATVAAAVLLASLRAGTVEPAVEEADRGRGGEVGDLG